MSKRIDAIMLSTLIVLTLSSSWVQYHRQAEQNLPIEPTLPPIVEEVVNVLVPDFSKYIDVREKKNAFFDFMKPLIEKENERILAFRQRVLMLASKPALTESEREWLVDLAERYRMKKIAELDAAFYEELMNRVDVIPASLALVQSANESAWGTSRFALQGNNFFGQWCFSLGCGIVPGSRPAGETYEVRRFDGVSESVRSYMHNLNTNFQYEGMRELRLSRRENSQPITGPVLAQGLYAYSIRGVDYVEELVSMIASNDLLRYDLDEASNPES